MGRDKSPSQGDPVLSMHDTQDLPSDIKPYRLRSPTLVSVLRLAVQQSVAVVVLGLLLVRAVWRTAHKIGYQKARKSRCDAKENNECQPCYLRRKPIVVVFAQTHTSSSSRSKARSQGP